MNNTITFPVMCDGRTIANIFLTRREGVIDVEFKASKKCKLSIEEVWNAVMNATNSPKYLDVIKALGVGKEDFTLYGVQTQVGGKYNFGKYTLPNEVKMEHTKVLGNGKHVADIRIDKVGEGLEVYYREVADCGEDRNSIIHDVVLYQCDALFKEILEREKISVLSYEYVDSMADEAEWKLCARYRTLSDEEISEILKANTQKDEAAVEEQAEAKATFSSKLEFEIETGPEEPSSKFGWKSKVLIGLAVVGAVAGVAYAFTKK